MDVAVTTSIATIAIGTESQYVDYLAGCTSSDTEEIFPEEPHGDSQFLASEIAGITTYCLADSGYTTNLVSKQYFHYLPKALQATLVPRSATG